SRPQLKAGSFLAMGSTGGGATRGVMSLALQHLHDHAPKPVDILDLPAGAPFGAVQVRIEGCTLCLACVGVCPTVALKDNPEKPQLRFSEAACIQCGLCKVTCPEKVITLTPRLNFVDDIHPHRVIKEEEPFECIRCGKPFGARSTIETMVGKLADHPMFAGKGGTDLIKMCEDCRVIAQMEEPNQPLAHKERPLPRTTDDYLREREELRKQAKEDAAGRGEE
ncbi:MAG: 4Fe-4S ferredoxin, partial [Rhodospirillales bacterium]|nr:4Fe-4S ferredoxin [Rhodospirillales bacterium]